MGAGVVVDPFMGSGSTVAAAEAVGMTAIGVERFANYYRMAAEVVPKLAAIHPDDPRSADENFPPDQQTLFALG
jgi:site-specific DNA-methyltransferase (adenine-specific)